MAVSIFTYGSLMFPEVWQRVVLGNYKSVPTYTNNISRRKIIGDTYPVALPSSNATPLEGILYQNISARDLKRLDEFEGKYYTRKPIIVRDQQENEYQANIYMLRNRYSSLASASEWSPEVFAEASIKRFMRTYVAKRV